MWRFVPLAFLVFFTAVVGVRNAIHIRRTGESGNFILRTKDPRQRMRDACGVIVVVIFSVQAIRAAGGAVAIADSDVARWIGALFAFGGVLLTFSAQMGLGTSWRIGIEAEARPGLVTEGWYSLCRNPIFLFMLVALGGFALLMWNSLTTILFVALCLGIARQVREEEAWLLRAYGEEYRRYAQRVGRFLPGVGKLA